LGPKRTRAGKKQEQSGRDLCLNRETKTMEARKKDAPRRGRKKIRKNDSCSCRTNPKLQIGEAAKKNCADQSWTRASAQNFSKAKKGGSTGTNEPKIFKHAAESLSVDAQKKERRHRSQKERQFRKEWKEEGSGDSSESRDGKKGKMCRKVTRILARSAKHRCGALLNEGKKAAGMATSETREKYGTGWGGERKCFYDKKQRKSKKKGGGKDNTNGSRQKKRLPTKRNDERTPI